MSAHKTLAKYERTHTRWREALEQRDAPDFERGPRGGGWNLGQVCDHVTEASRAFLDGSESLLAGNGEQRGGGLMPMVVFGIGSLPPGCHKVPTGLPPEYSRLGSPESLQKIDALQGLEQTRERMQSMCERVAAAPGNLRSKHPVAGWLNAAQWYQLSEMHLRHHLRQLRRLEQELVSSG